MKFVNLILGSFFMFCFLNSYAQTEASEVGNVEIIQDSRINTLLEKHKVINEKYPFIEGYRIQIYFESGNYSKKKAGDVKARFQNLFPEADAYIIFQEPYYKIRVGDFRTRLDAQAFLQKIISDFPNAFVVKENQINFPKID